MCKCIQLKQNYCSSSTYPNAIWYGLIYEVYARARIVFKWYLGPILGLNRGNFLVECLTNSNLALPHIDLLMIRVGRRWPWCWRRSRCTWWRCGAWRSSWAARPGTTLTWPSTPVTWSDSSSRLTLYMHFMQVQGRRCHRPRHA